MRGKWAWALAFAAGTCAGRWLESPALRAQAPAATAAPAAGQENAKPTAANPRDRGLDALAFIQSSAEYRACCLQTYRWAAERLKRRLADLPPTAKVPAVVLDLDETVLDNSAFNALLDGRGVPYSQPLWDEFEVSGGKLVRLVPGAEDFLRSAVQQGAMVVFISNRSAKNRKHTEAVVDRLVPVSYELLLAPEGVSDKSARRAAVAAKYRVAMWVGDQLTDFDQAFAADRTLPAAKRVAGRFQALEERQHRLGDEWVILPNPMYGEWLRGAEKTTDDTRQLLRPLEPLPAAP